MAFEDEERTVFRLCRSLGCFLNKLECEVW